LLSKGNQKPALAVRAVKDAIEDAKRAGEIVRRVRSVFKGHETHKEALDIGELVNEVLRLMSSEAALREIHVEIEVSHSIPPVVGDRILLQQCVLNLLGNAFDSITDAMSKQRRVTIGIAPETPGWIAITVCDTGAGIQPSVADRLFEPFVTTKSNGMGLGLLVTRSIIEDHGGKIWSTSNTQAGATFTFTLPMAKKDARTGLNPNGRKR
jgi:two-component system sensor kinase FixL